MSNIRSPSSENDLDLIFPTDEPSECKVDKVFLIVSGIAVLLFTGLLGTVFMVFIHIERQKHRGCSDGYETAKEVDYCYKVYHNYLNFSCAVSHCHQEHGTVAYALNPKTNKFLMEFYRNRTKEAKKHDFFMGVWFGSDNKWKLVNGTEVSYFKWDIGMPTNNAMWTVVVAQTEKGKHGTWRNVNFGKALPYICQRDK